ncbi:hypothetical protein B0H13DRAFT_2330379 [Mycena leptocephala]|nr:hypothetical protein B0H13DRAFT_2330379 [Mycena leptocephala]
MAWEARELTLVGTEAPAVTPAQEAMVAMVAQEVPGAEVPGVQEAREALVEELVREARAARQGEVGVVQELAPLARRYAALHQRFNVDAVIVTTVPRRLCRSAGGISNPVAAFCTPRPNCAYLKLCAHLRVTTLPPPSSLSGSCGLNLLSPSRRSSNQLCTVLLIPQRITKTQLLVPHAYPSGGSRRAEVYPYNDASIARRASVTTPAISGETLAMPSATYARLRARRRRPSRRRTPSCEFATRPASAAGASLVTPQNHMCSISFLTLRSRATSTISNARPSRAGTSSSAAQRFEGLDRLRIIRGITSST